MHGQRIGYVRVSSFDQNPERQLEHVSVDRIFTDTTSGKTIQARAPVFVAPSPDGAAPPAAQHLTALDAAGRRLVAQADTFFIASAHPQSAAPAGRAHGVDVSHRGGRPGFGHVDADGHTLTVPDFASNLFFNTLGNLALDPRAGLLFIDFDNGELLHIAARAELRWDGPEVDAFAGAERLLRLQVEAVLRRPAALPLRWGAAEISPHLTGTARWAEAGGRLGQEMRL